MRCALSPQAPKFDYFCWDLYTRVTQWLAEDKSRLEIRSQTLKDIEEGHGDAAKMAEAVSTAIVHCHLKTLDRLGIDYDLLARESDVLHLKFWDAAFELLKQSGAIELATAGKNAGCWVMQLPSDKEVPQKQRASRRRRRGRGGAHRTGGSENYRALERHGDVCGQRYRLPSLEIRLAEPGFSLSPLPHASRRARGVDDRFDFRRRGSAGIWPRARSFQRDRFAAGVSAAGGGGRIARAGTRGRGRSLETFFVQRGGVDAALRAWRWATRFLRRIRRNLTSK